METLQKLQNEIVSFLRKRDYLVVRELGQGACGKTVLIHDDVIDEDFVCKKYLPYSESAREALFENFLREIKLLHGIHHPNLVRIFNYYIYPDQFAGYILMEFVDGMEIDQFVESNPHKLDRLFVQAIEGFSYLEGCGILHRDIRMGNLMVDKSDQLKIIDLGFGKRITTPADYEKSITLNWWCETPREFQEQRYDHATEIYFLGKLFEKLVQDNGIQSFRYRDLIRKMCSIESEHRYDSFVTVRSSLNQQSEVKGEFSEDSKIIYRQFADALVEQISEIEFSAGYLEEVGKVLQKLEDVYRSVMLEEEIPSSEMIVDCFISGSYYYRRNNLMRVRYLRAFLELFRGLAPDFQKIVLANLRGRLDAVKRYVKDEDIPF